MKIEAFIAEGEHKYQEFKERYSTSMMKTVSAFSNDHDGKIVIGISDSGTVIGVEDSEEVRLKIENAINDSIRPKPYFEVTVYTIDYRDILVFDIYKGENTPYVYQKKAYQRMDTSTVEVDRERYDELVLYGKNLEYEELQYDADKIRFDLLEKKLSDELEIQTLDLNVLKSLELYKNRGYNIAAGLLSDENRFSRIGLDVICYRDNSMTMIEDRRSLNGVSILKHYDVCMEFYHKYVKQKDIIKGEQRKSFSQVPIVAYREAIINAIIHRDYKRQANSRVEFFEDRIEILSVGGLPRGTTKEEFIKGSYSNLRNRILADMFFRLGYIEKMGTGIRRIKRSYSRYNITPLIVVMANSIKIVLPFVSEIELESTETKSIPHSLTGELEKLYKFIQVNGETSRKEVESYMNVKKTKAVKLLGDLIESDIITKKGNGKLVKYKIH